MQFSLRTAVQFSGRTDFIEQGSGNIGNTEYIRKEGKGAIQARYISAQNYVEEGRPTSGKSKGLSHVGQRIQSNGQCLADFSRSLSISLPGVLQPGDGRVLVVALVHDEGDGEAEVGTERVQENRPAWRLEEVIQATLQDIVSTSTDNRAPDFVGSF